ncbi:MAG TPA: AAA family ATPase [Candidatus Limnocylindrales bacterium]|jgi:ATP-dependent Clp protease ATP-binding subunit ClpA|nr:AAA family ATPase [Candidatus Limnocylindrales bacterium]
MRTGLNTALDPTLRSSDARDFEAGLRRKIVGQDPAVEKVVEIYQMYLAGLNAPGRPVGNLLFLGPTGSGKTRVVEAMAEALFGDPRAVIKIDCAEFQHSHEIAKLIGSPPGYLGHRETHPLLTQEALNQWHTDKLKLTLLLFDEIEKASDALWQLLLGILDKATLTLGDNRRVDLSQCLIVMTSNLGAGEMNDILSGGLGFAKPKKMEQIIDARVDEKITRSAQEAARRKFSPEFMNRIDKIVVFKTLKPEHLEHILEIELGMVQQRILQATGNHQFVFSCTGPVKGFLLREGTDPKYGARHLKRAIEKNIVFPLANLVATGQIKLGDFIRIDMKNETLTFTKEAEGALVPVLLEKYGDTNPTGAVAARASRGNSKSRATEFGGSGSLLDHK